MPHASQDDVLAGLPEVVAGYARRLHAAIGDGHHVASPLGAWLVLAPAAPAAHAPRRGAGVQAATARYDGFEAAAVTALVMATSAVVPRPGRRRDALLRFDRPYAVVATTPTDHPSPWHGLPVFSAWVTEPDDAGPDDAR